MKSENVMGNLRNSWSIRDVALRNGVSEQFVRLEIARGRLKAKKVARRVLIFLTSEQAWLEAAPDK